MKLRSRGLLCPPSVPLPQAGHHAPRLRLPPPLLWPIRCGSVFLTEFPQPRGGMARVPLGGIIPRLGSLYFLLPKSQGSIPPWLWPERTLSQKSLPFYWEIFNVKGRSEPLPAGPETPGVGGRGRGLGRGCPGAQGVRWPLRAPASPWAVPPHHLHQPLQPPRTSPSTGAAAPTPSTSHGAKLTEHACVHAHGPRPAGTRRPRSREACPRCRPRPPLPRPRPWRHCAVRYRSIFILDTRCNQSSIFFY